MMRRSTRFLTGLGVLAAAGAFLAFSPHAPVATDAPEGSEASVAVADGEAAWHVKATGARIIGGYGNNFAYDGENVRPIEGWAEARIYPEKGTGKVEVMLETTEESGPIHFANDTKWTGKIKIVQKLDVEKKMGRIAQEVFLHGDTGNEAPVMPKIYNYFATWGPAKVWVNGEEVIPKIGSHTMFSEEARGESGKIARGSTIYHPMKVADKTGFTDPSDVEFHFVSHTTETDQNNFPPHTGWIHLHFSDVEVMSKPEGVTIPYTRAAQADRY